MFKGINPLITRTISASVLRVGLVIMRIAEIYQYKKMLLLSEVEFNMILTD